MSLWTQKVLQNYLLGYKKFHKRKENKDSMMLWEKVIWANILERLDVLCCAQQLQSCPTLGNLEDCSPPGSSVHGILQARILEWVAIPSSRGSSQPRDQT